MIIVSALSHAQDLVARLRPARSLSLMAPWQRVVFNEDWLPEQRLILAFNDVVETGSVHVAPDDAIVRRIIDFAHGCESGEDVLVHCWMGVSRSPAAAYIIACARAPGDEHAIAEELRRCSPVATPNRLMVAIADDILARNGRMVEAIERIGRGCEYDGEAGPFCLPLDWRDGPAHQI
ncbi:tyrosine phosphatase family protein [Rhodopseudomonas sp. NSM]|uniref:tyrosine phosphatase family protein n=1 Tax=Rhodopseudomonas sp. NSM TaxID=3457630 RepID=UPI0040371BCB